MGSFGVGVDGGRVLLAAWVAAGVYFFSKLL